MILASATGTFVTQVVGTGGAASTIVPVAAQGIAYRHDEPSIVVLSAPGFGSIPKRFGMAPVIILPLIELSLLSFLSFDILLSYLLTCFHLNF